MPKTKSSHILNTSANLLGLCFIVLTSVKVSKMGGVTFIDETAAAAIFLFMTSCILSFLSIRRGDAASDKLEKIADIAFLSGLVILFVTTMMITFNVIK